MISTGSPSADRSLKDYTLSPFQTPISGLLIQNATDSGLYAKTQFIPGRVLAYSLTRTGDPQSNTCQVTLADDAADTVSFSPGSRHASQFQPGVVDNKFILLSGYKGPNYYGTSDFNSANMQLVQRFTGFLEIDASKYSRGKLDKTISLIDLTKQFRFLFSDTLPHKLYGNQSLSYFDPTYNLYPINSDGTNATLWQCDGRMFTTSSSDKVWGANHINVNVYVDTSGGAAPATASVDPSTYTFDYRNGIVSFATTIPIGSIVSVSGNPTYMAPETMLRKLLVEMCGWSENFLELDTSGTLIPQFSGSDRSVWECCKLIASQCAPRYIPWTFHADENGFLKFYESREDGPPVRTFVNGRDILLGNYEFSSRNLRTVVRGDATCYTSTGQQAVVALAYDVRSIAKYGQTEPLMLSNDLTLSVQHLTPVQASSQLNMLAASRLAEVSRPVLSVSADIVPDLRLQCGDKIRVIDNTKILMDKAFRITQITETASNMDRKMTLTLEEIVDTINYQIGSPAAVALTGTARGATTSPPSQSLIGAVRMGSNGGIFAFQNGDYVDPAEDGTVPIPVWDVLDGTPMRFDVFMTSPGAADTSTPSSNPDNPQMSSYGPWSYTNLPNNYGGVMTYTWVATLNPDTNQIFYYGVDPTDGQTVCATPDSLFYKFAHSPPMTAADASSFWTPPGNVTPVFANTSTSTGTAQPGTQYQVAIWSWFEMCLDSNFGSSKSVRPVVRVNPSQDGVAINLPPTASLGTWIYQGFSGPPGPPPGGTNQYYHSSVIVGASDYVTAPVGFVSSSVLNDPGGTHVGCAFGNPAPTGLFPIGYQKVNRGYFYVYALSGSGGSQFLRIPFTVIL